MSFEPILTTSIARVISRPEINRRLSIHRVKLIMFKCNSRKLIRDNTRNLRFTRRIALMTIRQRTSVQTIQPQVRLGPITMVRFPLHSMQLPFIHIHRRTSRIMVIRRPARPTIRQVAIGAPFHTLQTIQLLLRFSRRRRTIARPTARRHNKVVKRKTIRTRYSLINIKSRLLPDIVRLIRITQNSNLIRSIAIRHVQFSRILNRPHVRNKNR